MSKQVDGRTIHIAAHTVEVEVEIIVVATIPVRPAIAACRVEAVLHPEPSATSTSTRLCFMVVGISAAAEGDIVAPTHRESLSVEPEGHPVHVVEAIVSPSVNPQGNVGRRIGEYLCIPVGMLNPVVVEQLG